MRKGERQPMAHRHDGTIVVGPGFRLSGALKGRAKKRTAKQKRALAEGRRQTKAERDAVALTGRRNAAEVHGAYDAAAEGDFGPLTRLTLRRHARASMLVDSSLDAVEADGLIVTEDAMDAQGNVIASKKRIHPAAEFALKSAETFGLTAADQLLTPRARGVAKKDDRLGEFLERQARIRGELALNGPVVDAEIVDEEKA